MYKITKKSGKSFLESFGKALVNEEEMLYNVYVKNCEMVYIFGYIPLYHNFLCSAIAFDNKN